MRRWTHLWQAGLSSEHRRFDLIQAAHDFRRGGGLALSTVDHEGSLLLLVMMGC
jgi:CelD/BcsL family acetyltransferase involved in cellulose biosynthesis